MLHSDDLPDDFDPEAWRWVEYRVRMLVPRGAPAGTMGDLFEHERAQALDLDATSRAYVGKPGRCITCGEVTIDAAGFPWGDAYGSVPYCPHCTGGEDVL